MNKILNIRFLGLQRQNNHFLNDELYNFQFIKYSYL